MPLYINVARQDRPVMTLLYGALQSVGYIIPEILGALKEAAMLGGSNFRRRPPHKIVLADLFVRN